MPTASYGKAVELHLFIFHFYFIIEYRHDVKIKRCLTNRAPHFHSSAPDFDTAGHTSRFLSSFGSFHKGMRPLICKHNVVYNPLTLTSWHSKKEKWHFHHYLNEVRMCAWVNLWNAVSFSVTASPTQTIFFQKILWEKDICSIFLSFSPPLISLFISIIKDMLDIRSKNCFLYFIHVKVMAY